MARTLTFLFTDIEGSTRLWEQEGGRMGEWVARHDELLHKAVESHGGHIFKHVGDGICACFETAPPAVHAAADAQVALQKGLPELKVRMGMHTGAVEVRGDDFFGPPLNRVARLMSAGYGGQILLSQATAELSRDNLPSTANLESLGVHRLRDLERPEHVFQLNHPALPGEFDHLRSLDFLPNNLPQQLTSFIGREKELAEVRELVKTSRLTTLTGSGGAGKTRLGLQVAADLLEDYENGVWLVELAPLSEDAQVVQAVASALRVREDPVKGILPSLQSAVRDWQALIILDNCEHLVQAVASLADTLLRSCPNLTILATSREALGVPGEVAWRTPSLSLPDPGQPQTLEALGQFEAVKLFIDRATTVHAGFAVDNETAPFLAKICHKLDGIPLAIELAAARSKALSLEQIAQRLDDRFRLLTSGSRTAMARQQTLRAAIDWSHDLLTEEEKVALRRLAVFSGTFGLQPAERIIAWEPIEPWQVLDLLTQLLDKSLLSAESVGGETRYRMLETVRQYAHEKLAAEVETERAQSNHVKHYRKWLEENFKYFYGGKQQAWFAAVDLEAENFRAALEYGSSNKLWQAVLSISGHLYTFWETRSRIRDGVNWIEVALQNDDGWQPEVTLRALLSAGRLLAVMCEFERSQKLYERGLEIARREGDELLESDLLNAIGLLEIDQDRDEIAQPYLEDALAIKKRIGDTWGVAAVSANLGITQMDLGSMEEASRLWRNAIRDFEEVGDHRAVGVLCNNLGLAELMQGNLQASEELIQKSIGAHEELGNKTGSALSRSNLARLYWKKSQFSDALAYYRKALEVYRVMGDRLMMLSIVLDLGALAVDAGDYEQGAVLLACAKKQYAEAKGAPPRVTVGDAEKAQETVEARLTREELETARARGHSLGFEAMLRYVHEMKLVETQPTDGGGTRSV